LQSQATQSLQHSFIITSLAFTVEGSGDGGKITERGRQGQYALYSAGVLEQKKGE
jgi:hypothetical protein